MRIEIGPVDVEAARCWLPHVLAGLETVRARRHALPFRFPDEVADEIEALLGGWLAHARSATAEFHWVGILDEAQVRRLVQYWANLDSLTDDQVRGLGVDWAPAGGRPFFVALTTAVADALAGAEQGVDPFATLLVAHGDRPVRSVRTA
jgi:hypothetical protein